MGRKAINQLTCPRCGLPGTLKLESGRYFRIWHYLPQRYQARRAKGMKSCYIGKADPTHLLVRLRRFPNLIERNVDLALISNKAKTLARRTSKPSDKPVFEKHEYEEFLEVLYDVRLTFEYSKKFHDLKQKEVRLQKELIHLENVRAENDKKLGELKRHLITKKEPCPHCTRPLLIHLDIYGRLSNISGGQIRIMKPNT